MTPQNNSSVILSSNGHSCPSSTWRTPADLRGCTPELQVCASDPFSEPELGTEAEFVFFALEIGDLVDLETRFTLTPEDFALLNPNTRTCPIFKSRDAELTKGIYRRFPILARRRRAWPGLRLGTLLHAFNALYGLFVIQQMRAWRSTELAIFVPLWEGKMFSILDHRFGEFPADDLIQRRPLARQAKRNSMQRHCYWVPYEMATPRYWVRTGTLMRRSRRL